MTTDTRLVSFKRLGRTTTPLAGILACLASTVAAEELTPMWVAQHPSTTGILLDEDVNVAVDSDGAVYVVGSTGNLTTADTLTVKYGPDGAELWVAQYAGSPAGTELGRGVTIDSAGDVIVISSASSNFTVIKYDPADGSEVWAVNHDAGGTDKPNAVTVDTTGNIYVTGQSWIGEGEWDYYTLKLDGDGNVLWTARYNNSGGGLFQHDIAVAIGLDSHGDVFVTGTSNRAFSAVEEYATIKYRGSDGLMLWLARYGQNGSNTIATALAVNPEDDVYVTGGSFQNGHFIATIRYDGTNGAAEWIALDDPQGRDRGMAIKLDSVGDVYVAGWSDPDNDESNFNEDIVTLKLRASDGGREWMTLFGSPAVGAFDLGYALAVDAGDNVYVTGENTGKCILFRYDSATGDEVDHDLILGDPNEFTVGLALALDPSQNVVVSGLTNDFNTTASDFLTAKYEHAASVLPGIVSVVSMNGHVGVGDVGVDIDISARVEVDSGAVSTEPRVDGVSRLEITFADALDPLVGDLGAAAVTITPDPGVDVATSVIDGGATLVLDFAPALPDAETYTFALTDSVIAAMTATPGDRKFELRALVGNVASESGSGPQIVNAIDLGLANGIRGRFGANVGNPTNAPFDVNQDSLINAVDMSCVRLTCGLFGNTAP